MSEGQVNDRLRGTRRAQEKHGKSVTLTVMELTVPTMLEGRAAGAMILRRSQTHRPDGIFPVDDPIAIGLLQSFASSNSPRVPGDIKLSATTI